MVIFFTNESSYNNCGIINCCDLFIYYSKKICKHTMKHSKISFKNNRRQLKVYYALICQYIIKQIFHKSSLSSQTIIKNTFILIQHQYTTINNFHFGYVAILYCLQFQQKVICAFTAKVFGVVIFFNND